MKNNINIHEAVGDAPCVVYGRDTNANYPMLRLDYTTTNGSGVFVVWWDGGFNNDSTRHYVVELSGDPIIAIERVLRVCSLVAISSSAMSAIKSRGDLPRLDAFQTASFNRENRTIGESGETVGVHGYVVWGHDTNLEIPGCFVDFDGRYECYYRNNTINANSRNMLLAYNDDPSALIRAARKRHSYVIISLRAMSRMQASGLDLSSIKEASMSENIGIASVRHAARSLRSGRGNIDDARHTLSQYGFTTRQLSEIAMDSSTRRLLDRIDRLCEKSYISATKTPAFDVSVSFDNRADAYAFQRYIDDKTRLFQNTVWKASSDVERDGNTYIVNIGVFSATEKAAILAVRRMLAANNLEESVNEISTGALVWAQNHPEQFPENKIGGRKGKYKARKVGQYGAKSLVNESGGDWAVFVKYVGDGNGPYDVVSCHPTEADAEQRLKREISQRKLKHPDTFLDAWVAMHPDAAMRDYKKRKGVSEAARDNFAHDVNYEGPFRAEWAPVGKRPWKIVDKNGKGYRKNARDAYPVGFDDAAKARAFVSELNGRRVQETADEKATYISHAKKLLQASTDAVTADRSEEEGSSRHATPWGLGYRAYLKTILRGDDPTKTKPKGDHLAGWTQARHDLVSLDPMTEARKGPAKFKQSDRPGHSVRASDIPRFMLARNIDPDKVSADDHDAALNYLTQTLAPSQLRANSNIAYQQAKALWSKGEKSGALSQHWWGSMYAKAAGDSFIPASALFAESAPVSKALPSGVNEVSGYTLRDSDKKVVKAWVQQKPAEGKWIVSDGTTLRTTSLGAADMAKWLNGKPYIGPSYGNVSQTLVNFIRKELKSQGMTTIGRMSAKGVPDEASSESYRSIGDSKIDDLGEGPTEVWYAKSRMLGESIATLCRESLPETHVLIGKVRCNSPSRLFVLMQEEKWSPHGEATSMLNEHGIGRVSMGVGDVIGANGRYYVVAERGFRRIV